MVLQPAEKMAEDKGRRRRKWHPEETAVARGVKRHKPYFSSLRTFDITVFSSAIHSKCGVLLIRGVLSVKTISHSHNRYAIILVTLRKSRTRLSFPLDLLRKGFKMQPKKREKPTMVMKTLKNQVMQVK